MARVAGKTSLRKHSLTAKLYASIIIALMASSISLAFMATSLAEGSQQQSVGHRVMVGGWVYVPAVTDHKGTLVNLSITFSWPGRGLIEVSSEGSVSASTAYSISAAIWTSAILLGVNPLSFDTKVFIHAGGTVSGPSASLAAATLALALLSSSYTPGRLHNYVITGAIVPQGFAGPIGGVNEKCEAAVGGNLSFILPVANMVELSSSCRSINTSRHHIYTVGTVFESYSLIAGITPLNTLGSPNTTYPDAMKRVLAEAARLMIKKTNATLEKIESIINNKENYINVSSIISNIKREVALSSSTINKYPYSAASLAFTALSQSLGLYYALLLNEGRLDDKKIVDYIRNNLTFMKEYIVGEEGNATCLDKLEILSVAAARISDSLWNLETYEELRKSGGASPLDLGYTLGLAEARIYSIKSWIDVFNAIPCTTPSPADFYNYIKLVRYFSVLNGNYTISVLEEVGFNSTASMLRDLIDRADRAFRENDTVLALGYYREILSLSTEMMFSKLILSEYNRKPILERYLVSGKKLYYYTYYALALHGIRSVLAPAYLEYAHVLASTSDMNSSIPILASAIAANEVLLPLTLTPPPPSNVSPNVTTPGGRGSPRTLPAGRALAALVSAAVIGFSVGVALALRMSLAYHRRMPY